eukprot:2689459-Lingulodinium_polyedra.AAC.1
MSSCAGLFAAFGAGASSSAVAFSRDRGSQMAVRSIAFCARRQSIGRPTDRLTRAGGAEAMFAWPSIGA